MKNKITNIIVHCSDSEFGDRNEINKWHVQRGFREIAYHFVVLNGFIVPGFQLAALDGSVEVGRELDADSFIEDNEAGAHALGYNETSVGICLIGVRSFTPDQMTSALNLVRQLMARYGIPAGQVLGHCETASGKKEGKTCPNFDMGNFRFQL